MEYIGYFFRLILVLTFIALAVIDWKKFKLPDYLQISAVILITIVFCISETDWMKQITGLVVALTTGLTIYYFSSFFYKKQVFGFGDVKLIALIGYLGGIQYFLFIFVGGTILATVFALTGLLLGRYNWQSKIPLGTFLCTGAVIFILLIYL